MKIFSNSNSNSDNTKNRKITTPLASKKKKTTSQLLASAKQKLSKEKHSHKLS